MKHNWKRVAVLAGLMTCTGAPLFAQSVEVGATLGIGARGSEDSLFRNEALPVAGVHLSAWWADRVETAFRLAWLDLPDPQWTTIYYYGCDRDVATGRCRPTGNVRVISRRGGPRRFMAGQALYHFRRGRSLRPYAGVGIGVIRDSEMVGCEVAGCEPLLPGLAFGRRVSSYLDVTGIGGMSTVIGRHIVVRGGVQWHRIAGEELSLFEIAAGVGYRF